MKTILVLLDGLSDRPQKVLKGKTPLQAHFGLMGYPMEAFPGRGIISALTLEEELEEETLYLMKT